MKKQLQMEKISFPAEDFKIVFGGSYATTSKAYHEDVEIKYYLEETTLLIDSNLILAAPGDITFVNPYEIHSNIRIPNGRTGSYHCLMIGLDFFAPFEGEYLNLRKLFVSDGKKIRNHIQNNARLQSVVMRIVEELQNKEEHYKAVVRGLVEELFVLLLRHERAQEREERETEEKKHVAAIMPALSKIYTDYAKELTVEELAALCNTSKYHFCRLFKKAMGKTAVQYLISYRIDVAEMLLKTTDQNVSEIAWQCGFLDESYFYRCYKRWKGVSPSKARKLLRD
ncbi:MAG: helix-turn-helix transcriptional regulator [Clostridia bacterium]|nr:helix-turn-helix transcriptional regulator [Clostridia bacterium]